MSRDFSWGASAKEYVKVYERARQARSASSSA
jgi:glycogen synthase